MADSVPAEHDILRLPRPERDYVPTRYKPSGTEFMPSSEDKRVAEEANVPVRVSVWDETRTTIDEAKAFRPDVQVLVLRGRVGDVTSVDSRVRVVYDPLPPGEADRPGATGHAGIEGLDRFPPEESKKSRVARVNAVAEKFVAVDGHPR